MLKKFVVVCTAASLAACSSDDPAMSGFASVGGTGANVKVNKTLEQEHNGYI